MKHLFSFVRCSVTMDPRLFWKRKLPFCCYSTLVHRYLCLQSDWVQESTSNNGVYHFTFWYSLWSSLRHEVECNYGWMLWVLNRRVRVEQEDGRIFGRSPEALGSNNKVLSVVSPTSRPWQFSPLSDFWNQIITDTLILSWGELTVRQR